MINKKRVSDYQAAFMGKTISEVDATAVNCVTFFFSDGSSVELETESYGYGIMGIDVVKQVKP